MKSVITLGALGEVGRVVVAGSMRVMEFYRNLLQLPLTLQPIERVEDIANLPTTFDGVLPVLSVAEPQNPITPGVISAEAGRVAMEAILRGTQLCQSGVCDALVTAPIHKEALAKAGYTECGHTGLLGRLTGVASPTMMFYDRLTGLKVSLATIHEPLSRVPKLIRTMDLDNFLLKLATSLSVDFGISAPRIALLGLNPHASDGGVMGSEEAEFLIPAIQRLSPTLSIEGAFPADGFFGAKLYRNYDMVVAMYHDQGLLPFKVLAFETGVNVTLGLPIVRTSPDHGTGFDIAGKGVANSRSMEEAIRLAHVIARNRMK